MYVYIHKYEQEGSDSDRGINPRTLNRLFEMIRERSDYDYNVEFSIFEIYNEEIKDLLDREFQCAYVNVIGAYVYI
jgi:hypothetical protein